jgi:hypothetical protein
MKNPKGFLLAILVILFSILIDLAIVVEAIQFSTWSHLGARVIELVLMTSLLIFASLATDEEYDPKMAFTSLFVYAFLSGAGFLVLRIVNHSSMENVGFFLVTILLLAKILMAFITYIINDLLSLY